MEQRETYQQLRQCVMDRAYRTCRSHFDPARVGTTPDIIPHALTTFFHETYHCYDDDLIELMTRALELILWQEQEPPTVTKICHESIKAVLYRNSFEDLVADIPAKEAEELRTDLVLLKFLPDPRNSAVSYAHDEDRHTG